MSAAAQALLDEMAQRGVTARVDAKILRLKPREALDGDLLARIKEHKPEIIRVLAIPPMPPGVRLVAWNLKEPPIAIEYHAVVTDPAKFASAALGELRDRLANPKRKYGWSVPQLIDRLAQVGVTVALETANEFSEAHP